MSTASTTRTIQFAGKTGTYTVSIMSPNGDLFQEYDGPASAPTAIRPDYTTLKPILYFVAISSRASEGVATPSAIDFYFNGAKIEFSGDTSTGIFAGKFKKVSPAGDNLYYGLQILDNVAAMTGCVPATIKMVATVSYGTQTDTLLADYTIPVSQMTGDGYRVTIAAGDMKNFVITQKGESCILKALVFKAGAPVTANLTYQWYKMGNGTWDILTGQTGQTLTVNEADINTYGDYLVKAFLSGSEIGQDQQGVMDSSDPYDIDPCPTPPDETITEDPSGNGTVTYTPKIVKRGTTTQVLPASKFYFAVKEAAGNILNTNSGTAAASCVVTRAMCIQGGGDLSITIISEL